MNAALLLEHYARIADAPDAIARLRRFVLALAVRGKLVEQDIGDEPASVLLERISAERARLVKAGEAQKSKSFADAADDADFRLPPTWVWTRLGSITSYIQRGKSPKYAEADGVPVISQKCVQWSGLDVGAARLITRQSLEAYEKIRFLRDGDLLWNSTGTGTIGRIIRLDGLPEQLVCDSHVTVVRCLGVNPEYVRIWLRSDHVYGTIEGRAAGSTNQIELTAQMATGQVVPLPSLAEQQRIVAKVDELMALCDQLEAARAEREVTRDTFTLSTLAKLNTPDPQTFADDARFALANLAPLTTRPDQITQLRHTVLNLAVRGKLVEQDAKDGYASELFQQVLESRRGYAAEKKIRGDKVPSSPDADFSLPKNWVLAALGQIAVVTDPNPSHRYPSYDGGTVPLLSTREFQGEHGWSPETAQLTTEEFWLFQQDFCDFAPCDIIFARKGRLGLPRYLPNLAKFTFSHTLFVVKPMKGVLPDYLLLQLRRRETVQWLVQEMNQNTGVPTLGKAKMEHLPIALPPLAEQRRIVAKADALMDLCDQLEASITTDEQTRSRLLEAVLHNSLEPA